MLTWLKQLANGGNADKTNVSTLGVRKLVRHDVDPVVLWVPVLLMFWGLVMVYSASVALPSSSKFESYSPYHFFGRHLLSITIALLASVFAFRLPTRTWEKLAPVLFVGTLLLLILVLIPHVGRVVGGSRRWLPCGQWFTSLVAIGRDEFAAVRSHETRQRTVCRQLLRAQTA